MENIRTSHTYRVLHMFFLRLFIAEIRTIVAKSILKTYETPPLGGMKIHKSGNSMGDPSR